MLKHTLYWIGLILLPVPLLMGQVVLSDFEGVVAGDYSSGATVDGWTVGTNEVSVVNSPAEACGGSQFLALVDGQISRQLPTVPGRRYQLHFAHRNQCLAAWWPGDGDGNDLVSTNIGLGLAGLNYSTGLVGQAFDFTGSGQALLVRRAPELNVGGGSGLTIECWLNPANLTNRQPLLEWNKDLSRIGARFWINDDRVAGGGAGYLMANLLDTSGANHVFVSAPGCLVANQWQHVALTYDRLNGIAAFYVNGVLITADLIGSFVPQTSYELFLGYRPPGASSSAYYRGRMDEVGLYGCALSEAEIQAIYRAGSRGKCNAMRCLPAAQVILGDAVYELRPEFTWQTAAIDFVAGHPNQTVWVVAGGPLSVLLDSFGFDGLEQSATITSQPRNVVVAAGQQAVFSVEIDGAVTNRATRQSSGGYLPDTNVIPVLHHAGTVQIQYEFFALRGRVSVFYGGSRIFDRGMVSGSGMFSVDWGPGIATNVTVVINEGGSALTYSLWTYEATVVSWPAATWQWRRNGLDIPNATRRVLVISDACLTDEGVYSVVVGDGLGIVESEPATLAVRIVFPAVAGELLPIVDGECRFTEPLLLEMRNWLHGGPIFYTLDGSEPTLASILYTGPILIERTTVLRTLALSEDFLLVHQDPPLRLTRLSGFDLSVSSSAGGSVNVSPGPGPYVEGTIVQVAAEPEPGWLFLGWQGDIGGTDPQASIVLTREKCVHAVFGTRLSTTVVGAGAVVLNPPGGLYPYGTRVRLYPLPDPRNFFVLWGNDGTGTNNPLTLQLTNPNPAVSSLFGPLPVNQFSLTVIPDGAGEIVSAPPGRFYTNGTPVSVTAIPGNRQNFAGWSGDAVGQMNPMVLIMNQNRVIRAHFTEEPFMAIGPCRSGINEAGFYFTITGEPEAAYLVEHSTNLEEWNELTVVTNAFGEVRVSDPAATNLTRRFYRALRLPQEPQ